MDPAGELDYGAEEYRGAKRIQHQGSGTIPALAEEELIGEDDEYEDLYNDVNVGDGLFQFHQTGGDPGSSNAFGNNGLQAQEPSAPEPRREVDVPRDLGPVGVKMDNYQNSGASFPEQKPELRSVQGSENVIHGPPPGNLGFQGPTPLGENNAGRGFNPVNGVSRVVPDIPNNQIVAANGSVNYTGGGDNIVRPPVDNGSTMLFVGELHWWTTDAELEDALSQYGKVKEIKFFDERASGKSKGYCQVEFYEPSSAAACKERMNGHVFNERACVVAFASAQTLKQMGAATANKNQTQQPLSQPQGAGRRGMNDGAGRGGGMNYPSGDAGRTFGRGSWGRGQGGFNRGAGNGGGPRGRGGPMAAKNPVMNPAGIGNGVGNFGQAMHGPAFGNIGNGMMHPQAMMGPGFDPSFMGRGAGYGNFTGPAYPGMMPSFPTVNTMGIPGVAPHVNPAFFGRAMTPNGMGMMGASGMDGHPGLMWGDPSMVGWGAEEHAQRTRESSYGGDDGASDYGHGDTSHEKGARSNATSREKERSSQRDLPGNSEKRHRAENEQDWDRSERFDRSNRNREDKNGYQDQRSKNRESGNDDDYDRGVSSSKSRSRSRAVPEDDRRSHSRDADYGKRRRE